MVSRPASAGDLALVLSGGGARAAYQAGVLKALAEIAPDLSIPIVTGVSAGAINASFLASHPGPLRETAMGLEHEWAGLTANRVYRVRPTGLLRGVFRGIVELLLNRERGPVALQGLLDMTPLRRYLARTIPLDRIESNIVQGRLRALGLTATSYGTGVTVTFVQGAPDTPMWTRAQRVAVRTHITHDHILASAAIPIVFPAVQLDGGFYGDGSVRQGAPLSPAIHLGAKRILAIGVRSPRPEVGDSSEVMEYPSAAEVMGLMLHSIFLDALDGDAERLERINHLLERMPPDIRPRHLHPVKLLVLRPSQDLGRMAQRYPVRLPTAVSLVVRAMGGRRERSADFVSYLLFQPPYTSDLIELGYADTLARRQEIAEFLELEPASTGGAVQ